MEVLETTETETAAETKESAALPDIEKPTPYITAPETGDFSVRPKNLYEYELKRNPSSRSRFVHAFRAWKEGQRRVISSDRELRDTKKRYLYSLTRIPYYFLSLTFDLPLTYFASYRHLKYSKQEKRYQLRDRESNQAI